MFRIVKAEESYNIREEIKHREKKSDKLTNSKHLISLLST
jgi:hypothetical protein